MPHLLVIGGPSIDLLHFQGKAKSSPGGAGLYTALAAQRSGCQVSMFSPKPDPMPEYLLPLETRLQAWFGPRVPVDELPHFTIIHHNENAIYQEFYAGEEARLNPAQLPPDLSVFDAVHIIGLGSVGQQLRFVDACRSRGAKQISISSFTLFDQENPDMVGQLVDKSDVFFLNQLEAKTVFESLETARTQPGKLLIITRGEHGVLVVQGDCRTALPAVPAELVDPTGAGDTFCGATLAGLLQGMHPIMAARRAMALASEVIADWGPKALLEGHQVPKIALDDRVRINRDQVTRVSQVIQTIPEAAPFNFVSEIYPPVNHHAALDYFFVQTLQQFSFWETRDGRYDKPLIATIAGRSLKGSAYLSYAYLRKLETEPDFFTPLRQAGLIEAEMVDLFRAEDGSDPMPTLALHLAKAQAYGKDMVSMGLTPGVIVERANQSDQPLATFSSMLDQIGGYKEDPFRKKSNLLAMILKERPESFLKLSQNEHIQPVIDYHVMRFCLRTGMVELVDHHLRDQVTGRMLVGQEDEWAIRYACYLAIQDLITLSGLSMGAVDNIAFNYNRKHCPEMTEPICELCAIDPACAHRKELFQPVIRTTFY